MTASAADPHVGLVVEGPGDLQAVPVLLRKYLALQADFRDLLGKPVPCNGRGNATRPTGIEGYVATAAGRPGCLGVLVVLDADEDHSCILGPELLGRAITSTHKPVRVCLAERNYEDWLGSAFESLQLGPRPAGSGLYAIKNALAPAAYVKPTWLPRLSERLDIEVARANAPSLQRLFGRFDELRAMVP